MPNSPILCRCGRRLTDPVSVARKLGPACWAAEHPELAPPHRTPVVSLPKPRPASEPMPGQEDLFELSKFPITDVGV